VRQPRPRPLGSEVDGPGHALLVNRVQAFSPGGELTCELWIEGASRLAGALLDLSFDPGQLELESIEDGGFLRGADGDLFFPRAGSGWAEVAVSRLDRHQPGIDGRGLAARLRFRILGLSASPLRLDYDLRSTSGATCSRGETTQGAFEGAAAGELHLASAPNPSFGSANILLSLPEAAGVTLELFDAGGRRVRSLLDAPLLPGYHVIPFDGRDDRGNNLPSGIYFYTLRADRAAATRRMVITR